MTETATLNTKKTFTGLTSFALHILAMLFMLSDHLWATVIPGNDWMTWVGRLAFPIFAFMIAEGYSHTKDFKKYAIRMLIFALISEIPYNLVYVTSFIYPFQQNVLWTFLVALLCMRGLDKIKDKYKIYITIPLSALLIGACYLLCQLTMTDYFGDGLLMVILFYYFKNTSLLGCLGQLAGMVAINIYMMKGLTIPFELFGNSFEFPQQGFAVLSLIFIWLYRGKQGPHNKITKFIFYSFYPAHLLILGLITYFS